jgi:lipopolysaccharide biosynthesis glycosyltransferase
MGIQLVSASDRSFFGLLQGLVRSIRAHPGGRELPFGVLDVGLDPDQERWLRDRNLEVVRPREDFDVRAREVERSFLARPFLPRYFPEGDVIVWLDADCWVQDWAAVELFTAAAESGALGIVAEVDRSYRPKALRKREALVRPGWFDRKLYRRYRHLYGRNVAATLIHHPTLNAGVFALHRDAPHWEAWSREYGSALRRSVHGMDQVALNGIVRHRGLAAAVLPAWCNWICHLATPLHDPERGLFVEPHPPHRTVGILHLTLESKKGDQRVRTTTGEERRMPLTYPG